MRVRGYSLVDEDKSQCFMMGRLLVYMDRLLARFHRLDHEILETIHWLLGPEIAEKDLLPLVLMLDTGERRRRFEPDVTEEVRHGRDFAHLMIQALLKIHKGDRLAVVDLFRGLLKERQDQFKYHGTSDIEKNLDAFQKMFGLSGVERELCLFFLILSIFEEAESLFEHHMRCDRYAGRGNLAATLDKAPSEISNSLGKLSRIGILEINRGCVSLEADFLRFLQDETEDINTEFFKKITPDPLSLDMHNVEADVTAHALRLLSPKNDNGCSVVVFGNPGVGKTTYAYGLAKELGLDLYVCKHDGKEKQWTRQAAVMASVHMVAQNPNSILIIDDCDAILGTRHLWGSFGAYNDKKWLHEILESNAKIIFIVNNIRLLEESVTRRFAFSIHFKPFGRTQRIQLWKNILQDQKISFALTDAQIFNLATVYDTSPGVIEQAVSNAAQTTLTSGEGFYNAVTIALDAHESLIHGGHKTSRRNPVDQNFILEGLNVVGTDLKALLRDLQALDKPRKESGESQPGCSILCYGPSGTGKSHLALHIASMLEKEALCKRGSDFLSPFVGETEERIRASYEEASAKDAVLVINEAESLVFSRDRGHRSWELSFTNEWLNSMEEYKDIIQIFTTNRLSDMDSASLRRFDYKLEFGYLKPEGISIFYNKFLRPLVGSPLQKELEDELQAISCLTPGDFEVVRHKSRFNAQREISHSTLVAALREEARLKELHSGKKAIGF